MKKTGLVYLSFLLSFSIFAQHTFSIIAADAQTGEIGAAGATCIDGISQFGGVQVINDIIPGRGGAIAQAAICINPNVNLLNAIARVRLRTPPQNIINALVNGDECSAQNFNSQYRQYGIVDLDPRDSSNVRVAAFTGSLASDYKGHIAGSNYSIQGNILIGPQILTGMEQAFLNTPGSLANKLMAAMQAAKVAGADSRCLSRGTSSTSAFLTVYKPTDLKEEPCLFVNVLEASFAEEPIDELQTLFNEAVINITKESCNCNNENNIDFEDDDLVDLFYEAITIFAPPGITDWASTFISGTPLDANGNPTNNIITDNGDGTYTTSFYLREGDIYSLNLTSASQNSCVPIVAGGNCQVCYPIPTLSQWALIVLCLVILCIFSIKLIADYCVGKMV